MVFLFRCGPFLIKTLGGPQANKLVGLFASVFALVSSARMLVSALSSALLPNLSRAEALGDIDLQKRYIKKSILFVLSVSLLVIILFGLLGPFIIKTVYGKEFILRRLDIFLIAAMGGFFFLAQLLNNILLARSLTKEVLISWGSALFILILFVWFARIETLLRVEAGLCLANFVALVLMLCMLRIKWRSYSK